jgi:Holliday junction resolvase
MAMTPEARVKKSIKKILDDHDVYHFSPFQAGMGRAGIPDIIACFQSHFIAIEAKAGDNQPTELQKRELKRIADHGGHALVINEKNLSQLEFLIKYLKGEI